jgi:hypothetical protein
MIMGQWNITIRGTGSHHNKNNPNDANRMAAKFVQELKGAGHSVVSASVTFGGEDDVTDATKYLSDRDKIEE